MPQGDIGTVHMDGKWYNVVEGTDQVSEPFDTMEDAADEGREMARELDVDHVVKNIDGTVLDLDSLGGDASRE